MAKQVQKFFLCLITLFFLSSNSSKGLLELNELTQDVRDNLRTYHGVTSVLQSDERIDEYFYYGYNGFANFCMVADQRDPTNPRKTLWYAVSRFMPHGVSLFSTKLTNNYNAQVRVNLNYNPATYREIYGNYGQLINGNYEEWITRNLSENNGNRIIFNLDNTLGEGREKHYRSQERILFSWPINGRIQANLPPLMVALQDNARIFNHTTLQDFVGHILALRSNATRNFPLYSLTGVAEACDALNCVSFSLRVLNSLGIDIRGAGLPNDQEEAGQYLARYLNHEQWNVGGKKTYITTTGVGMVVGGVLGSALGPAGVAAGAAAGGSIGGAATRVTNYVCYSYNGVPMAEPRPILRQLFLRFLGRTPYDINRIMVHENPDLTPFVGNFNSMALNFFPDGWGIFSRW